MEATAPQEPDHRRSEEAAAAMAKAKRRRRMALLVPPAVMILILLIGEVASRISGSHPVVGLVSAGERGWGPAPGVQDFGGVPATFSPTGTRGPEAAPGGILVVGDEMALGAGLRDDETLGAALARETGVPVTLAACEGYGTEQECLWVRELSARLKPRAVIIVFSFDDPRPFAATLFTGLRVRLQSVSALMASTFPGERAVTRPELHDLYDPEGVPFRLFKQSLHSLGDWSRRERIPVTLAIWPVMTKQDDALGEYLEQVRGEANMSDIEGRNLLRELGADGLEKLLLPNGRPNAEAVKRVARGLAKEPVEDDDEGH